MATRTATYLDAPEPFDPAGDDWSLYVEPFEHFVLTNGIKDEPKLQMLLALVGAQTYRLLTNLVAPKKPGEHTYAQVKEKLTAHLKPKPIKNRLYARYALRCMRMYVIKCGIRLKALIWNDFVTKIFCLCTAVGHVIRCIPIPLGSGGETTPSVALHRIRRIRQ